MNGIGLSSRDLSSRILSGSKGSSSVHFDIDIEVDRHIREAFVLFCR